MKFKRFIAAVSAAVMMGVCLVASSLANVTNVSATTIYGDVNNDGYVDISDYVALAMFLNGNQSYSSINMKYADVDKNAVIDVNDANTIIQYSVQNISSLPYSESGNTFNYYNYTFPTDSSRSYIKYNCNTKEKSSYALFPPSGSTYSGDTDDRQIDSSDNAQCIVYLSYKCGDGRYYRGTGFIIDEHIIATCAHCLYDYSNKTFNTNYTVDVYNSAGTSVVATYSPSELHVPLKYYNSQNGDYDYGLIYVEEDLSNYGTMPLGIVTDNFELTSQSVNVSGFPGYVRESYTTDRYYGVGNITGETTDYQLYYTTYANGGDSGGPVYIEYTLNGSTFRSAIGIHTHGYGDHSTHSGTRITLPLLRFYNNNSYIGG